MTAAISPGAVSHRAADLGPPLSVRSSPLNPNSTDPVLEERAISVSGADREPAIDAARTAPDGYDGVAEVRIGSPNLGTAEPVLPTWGPTRSHPWELSVGVEARFGGDGGGYAAEIGLNREDGLEGKLRFEADRSGEQSVRVEIRVPTGPGPARPNLDARERRILDRFDEALAPAHAELQAALLDPSASPEDRARAVQRAQAALVAEATDAAIALHNVRSGPPSSSLEDEFGAAIASAELARSLAEAGHPVDTAALTAELFSRLRTIGDNAPR